MKLNKTAKAVLGILTFLPMTLAISTFGLFLYHFFSMWSYPDPEIDMLFPWFLDYLLPYMFLIVLLCIGLFIFYLVHIIQNQRIDNEKRILWITVLVMLYGIAMPIYWFVHIWQDHSRADNQPDPIISHDYEPGTESEKF